MLPFPANPGRIGVHKTMLHNAARAYREGYHDAKNYCAPNRNTLNGYGRLRPQTSAELADYALGYRAGEKARTHADFLRWQRAVGD
jgi:hypothetical protein